MPTDDEADDAIGQMLLELAEAEARDLEHRRVLEEVRTKLGLGTGSPLYIDDRYRVIRRLGGGGMGEVYLCDDEDLHRQVAVKVVRGLGNVGDQDRLRREAQTLGPLSHSHIVVVHDVGEYEERTFLAMQYIEGQTLAQWLEVRRPWREVLARFVAAGRGLAAAHRAGVVHRDFKPGNVLLGNDGAVKVADFGLAVVEGRIDPHGEESLVTLSGSPGSRSSLGSAAGTARYMALEQLEGLSVDARSDQFGFCLALYEALWGRPPFADDDVRARREALSNGQPQVPTGLHGLWRVIRRGLARDPDQRWPSMDALLDALERVLWRRRQLARASTGAVLGLGLGLMAWESSDACRDVAHELDGVWDEERRDELERQLATIEARHAADSSRRVLEGLDQWAAAWLVARTHACEARDGQTEDCLGDQLEHVELFVDTLMQGDAAMLAQAVVAIDELPEPARCVDERPGFGPPPLALAGQVERVREEIARAQELRRLGELEEAHKIAEAANAAAQELTYGPVQAEALAELAKAEDVAGSPEQSATLYEAAIGLAEIHYHDWLAADLWVERAELSLFPLREAERGEWELHEAEIAYRRVGGPDERARARLQFGRGRIAELSKKPEVRMTAQMNYREVVVLARRLQDPSLPEYLDALARVSSSKDEAHALRVEAVEFAQEHFGPLHPRTASATYDLGCALLEAGEGGERELKTAVAIWTEVHERPDPKLAKAYLLLGRTAVKRGELDIAEAHARAMAQIQEQVLPEQHPERGEPEQLLATVEGVRRNHEAALTHARAALELFALAGPDDPGAWSMRYLVVDLLFALDRLDEAKVELDGMLAAQPAAPVHLLMAELAVRRHELDEADRQLRAVAAFDAPLGEHLFVYEVLRVLVDLRLGRLESAQIRADSPFDEAALATWFDELEVTPNERARLVPNKREN
jgi:tetratricopeptide (TPR) repeat protein/predicted Ser/Thr protein kinase